MTLAALIFDCVLNDCAGSNFRSEEDSAQANEGDAYTGPGVSALYPAGSSTHLLMCLVEYRLSVRLLSCDGCVIMAVNDFQFRRTIVQHGTVVRCRARTVRRR